MGAQRVRSEYKHSCIEERAKRNADPSRVGELFCWGGGFPGAALRLPLATFLRSYAAFELTRSARAMFTQKPETGK